MREIAGFGPATVLTTGGRRAICPILRLAGLPGFGGFLERLEIGKIGAAVAGVIALNAGVNGADLRPLLQSEIEN